MDDVVRIRALISAYAARLDAGELDRVAELFAEATWTSQGRVLTGPAIRSVYDDVILYDGVPGTRHVLSDVVVELAGGFATSRCSFVVYQALPDFPLQAILVGRYEDSFRRVAGKWRFASRSIHVDLRGDLSRHMRGAQR